MQVIGEAVVQVRPDLSKFDANLTRDLQNKVKPAAASAGTTLSSELTKAGETGGKQAGAAINSGLKTALSAGIGTVAVLGIRKIVSDISAEVTEAQRVGAQTDAVLKSTAGAAGLTADEISDLAQTISNKTAIDDEQIQAGENMLLTFKNVRNETGKNNDIFSQAAAISVDMAAAMAAVNGGEIDLKSSSIQLGKALNDPVRGITALTRVGVTFDEQQKARIRRFVEEGNVVGAQKIILAELRSEFEGSAAAQATAADRVRVAVANLEESLGTALLPVVEKAADVLGFLVGAFLDLPQPIQEAASFLALGGIALTGFLVVAGKVHQLTNVASNIGAIGTAATRAGQAAGLAAVGLTAFTLTLEGLNALGVDFAGDKIRDELKTVDDAVHTVAASSDKDLVGSFNRAVKASREAKVEVNGFKDVFGHGNTLVFGNKLVEQLGVFKQLATEDREKALALVEQWRRGGKDVSVFEDALARLAPKHKENVTQTQNHIDKLQALSGELDTTEDRFKNSVKVFGDWGTQTAIALGVPAKQLDKIAQLSLNFSKNLESSIAGATNPFQQFASASEVGTDEFESFLVNSQLAAIDWAQEIQSLIERGVDHGLIDQIAQAGPKSKPALDALVRAADDKGVEWINSVTHSSDAVVQATEDAYTRILVTTAIKGAEEKALRRAIQADIEGDTTSHLERLVGSSDKALSDMAAKALEQLRQIQGGVDSLHGKDIDINFNVIAHAIDQFGGNSITVAGLQAFQEQQRQFVEFLASLDQHATGGTFSGWSWVGERGPELINVGSSTATVLPNDLSTFLTRRPATVQSGQQLVDRSVNIGSLTMPVVENGTDAIDALFRRVEVEQFHARLP